MGDTDTSHDHSPSFFVNRGGAGGCYQSPRFDDLCTYSVLAVQRHFMPWETADLSLIWTTVLRRPGAVQSFKGLICR